MGGSQGYSSQSLTLKMHNLYDNEPNRHCWGGGGGGGGGGDEQSMHLPISAQPLNSCNLGELHTRLEPVGVSQLPGWPNFRGHRWPFRHCAAAVCQQALMPTKHQDWNATIFTARIIP